MALAQNPSIAALSNLVLYYDASNVKSFPGAGTSIYDMSGNNNTGTLTNGPLWSAANNGVISFDGTNDYIALPTLSLASNFTIEFWFKFSAYGGAWTGVVSNAYTQYGITIELNSSGYIILYTSSNGSTWTNTCSSASVLTTNTWYHYCGTADSGTAKIYLNGSQSGSNGTSATPIYNSQFSSPFIGKYANTGFYNGVISNIKIYNTALTATQIKQNYDATKGRFINTPFAPTDISGISIWFDADDPRTLFSNTSGTTRATTDGNSVALWVDKSGNGRNASQSTSGYQPLLKTSVLNNRNVIRFDGSDDYLSSVDLDLDYITMFVVTKLNTQTDSGNMAAVCGKSNQDPGRAPPYNLFIYGNVGDATYNYKSSFVSSTEAYPASYPYTNSQSTQNDSVFKLHTGRYDGTTRSYYINGGFQSYTTAQSGVLYKDNELFYIGIDVYSFLNRCFNGDIAEIIVYNSALSTTNRLKVEQYLQNKWGVVTPFLPTQITGLQLWLDSSDSGSLFQDSAAVIPAINDGDPVGCWKDKSGNGRNCSQSTSASRPTLKSSIQNSKNVIRFDGSNDFMNFSSITITSDMSIFCISRRLTSNTFTWFSPGDQTSTNGYGATIDSANGLYAQLSSDSGYIQYGTGYNSAATYLMTTVRTSSTQLVYRNGVEQAITATNGTRSVAGTLSRLGCRVNQDFMNGDFCELLVYNTALTLAQRQQVEAYLNQKWGVF